MRTRWKLQNLGRWAGLLALSVLVTVLVFLGGIVLLAWQTGEGQASSLGALRDVSQALTQEADGSYTLQNFDLPQDAAAWMLLLDADGNLVWQWNKPDELPTHYTLSQVASFSRWYLMDYPVQSLVRGDGLLLAGQAKGSLWIQRGIFPALHGPAPRLAAGDVFPGAVLRAGPGWPAPAAAVPPGTAGAG